MPAFSSSLECLAVFTAPLTRRLTTQIHLYRCSKQMYTGLPNLWMYEIWNHDGVLTIIGRVWISDLIDWQLRRPV